MIKENETTASRTFFNQSDHFQIMTSDLRARGVRAPAIWCAASASGEEPYLIAFACYEAGFKRFRVLASDIHGETFEMLNHGVYGESWIAEDSHGSLDRYLSNQGSLYDTRYFRVRPELRKRIVVKQPIQSTAPEFSSPVDAIFMRNVLAYFDHRTRIEIIDQVTQHLAPQGLLFLGHSENIAVESTATPLIAAGTSIYRRIALR